MNNTMLIDKILKLINNVDSTLGFKHPFFHYYCAKVLSTQHWKNRHRAMLDYSWIRSGSLFFVFLLVIFQSSCVSKKGMLNTTFTSDEYSSIQIMSGADEEPMRVYLITIPTDSIVLRTKSKDVVPNPKDPILQKFIKRLYSTVRDPKNPGVGIAAPQVGVLKNIIWVQRFDKVEEPFEVYLNPKILQYTKKTQFCLEGCLSIPERRDTTTDRAYAILIDYDKIDGTHHTEMVEAFTAVIFQHEIDHLNGILYIDHLDQEIKEAEERIKNH